MKANSISISHKFI